MFPEWSIGSVVFSPVAIYKIYSALFECARNLMIAPVLFRSCLHTVHMKRLYRGGLIVTILEEKVHLNQREILC
jgi:hypothetical protein